MPRAVKKLEEPHRATLIRVKSDTHSVVLTDDPRPRKKERPR